MRVMDLNYPESTERLHGMERKTGRSKKELKGGPVAWLWRWHTLHQKTPRCIRLHGETETHSKPHDGWSVKMGFGIHTVEKSAFFGHLPCVCVCVRIG